MLGENLLNSAIQSSAVLCGEIKRGENDDRYVPPFWIFLERRHNLEAVHFGNQ